MKTGTVCKFAQSFLKCKLAVDTAPYVYPRARTGIGKDVMQVPCHHALSSNASLHASANGKGSVRDPEELTDVSQQQTDCMRCGAGVAGACVHPLQPSSAPPAGSWLTSSPYMLGSGRCHLR